MKRNPSKTVTDLYRVLDTQKFETVEDLDKFMESLMGAPIPEIPEENLTIQLRAEDMVFAALEMPPDKAQVQVENALQLDPDCISAYEVLAALQESL